MSFVRIQLPVHVNAFDTQTHTQHTKREENRMKKKIQQNIPREGFNSKNKNGNENKKIQ